MNNSHRFIFGITFWILMIPHIIQAEEQSGQLRLRESTQLYNQGQYFQSAKTAFSVLEVEPRLKPQAYARMTQGLVKAGLPNLASYFFIRTLQSGHTNAIRSVLRQTQDLVAVVGIDLFKNYLITQTHDGDYDEKNRTFYRVALAKEALLSGDFKRAIEDLKGISRQSSVWPLMLQLRGTAHALLKENRAALNDFKACAEDAGDLQDRAGAGDLRARCLAGEARTYYQMNAFEEADQIYDNIDKRSLVWPDILFEQAWNSFSKQEYNRTLGKLVTYQSPGLGFLFNSEIDVLRAQSYLALCLYSDANTVINEFNAKYTKVGIQIKDFVEQNAGHLEFFYQLGKKVLADSRSTRNDLHRLMNRFIRGPYFQNLVQNERKLISEREAIRRFNGTPGRRHRGGSSERIQDQGFAGFLLQVLDWRQKNITAFGGAFVKNSLVDYHSILLNDFEKIAFIKLEMLKRSKDQLLPKRAVLARSSSDDGNRVRGLLEPVRRNNQYYWLFNGEFWSDEIGDYVFGLESACRD